MMYLVTFDGYKSYGCSIYALGVYDNIADAKKALASLENKLCGKITELKAGKTYKIEHDDTWDEHITEHFLGGYIE